MHAFISKKSTFPIVVIYLTHNWNKTQKKIKDEHTWVTKPPLCATTVNFDLSNVRFKCNENAVSARLEMWVAHDIIISRMFNLHLDYEPVEVDSQILYVCKACGDGRRREPHNCKTHNSTNAHKVAVEIFKTAWIPQPLVHKFPPTPRMISTEA